MRSDANESLIKAVQLAHFIHGDAALAISIATEAVARLEVTAAAQDKRLYYTPTGRSLSEQSKLQGLRTKVSLSELHLLQRLVYIESETHERRQEETASGATLDEEDMTIRFIKHLVKLTSKRNSFYVTLGLSRLLYNYATVETMNIYDAVIQDPERVRDDYYYRSRKKKLMQELQERFGKFLRLSKGLRREERFQAKDDPSEQCLLAKKCLSLFTPWNTACVVPDQWDPVTDALLPLSFEGDDPDGEHPIEVNRMHAVIHPDCYSRLTDALKLDPPEQRLAVPRFFLSEGEADDDRPRGDRHRPPELREEDLIAIQGELAERASRRKALPAGSLSVVVDGVERARINLNRTNHVGLRVEEDAELIEVRAHRKEGDVLLAAHLLTYDEDSTENKIKSYSITLEDGQKISFAIAMTKDSGGEAAQAFIDVTYRETQFVRQAALLLRQMKSRASGFLSFEPRPYPGLWKPALALALIVAGVISLLLYFQLISKPAGKQREIVAQQPPAADDKASSSGIEASKETPSQSENQNRASSAEIVKPNARPDERKIAPEKITTPQSPGEKIASERIAASTPQRKRTEPRAFERPRDLMPQQQDATSEATRALNGNQAPQTLLDAKRIFVDQLGADDFSSKVRAAIISGLQNSGRFTTVEKRDDADAVFKGTVKQRASSDDGREPEIEQMSLRLIGVNGDVLWPAAQTSSAGKYRGTVAQVAEQLVKDLIEDSGKKQK